MQKRLYVFIIFTKFTLLWGIRVKKWIAEVVSDGESLKKIVFLPENYVYLE